MADAVERSARYAFFANLFSYPGEELVEYLGEVAKAPALAGFDELDGFPQLGELESLQTDYTGLFISRLGGVAAQLYGSIYLDGRLAGESTLQVAVQYASEGLEVGDSMEAADFLPTELEYMNFLAERLCEALEAEDEERAEHTLRRQGEFFNSFLKPWVPAMCEKLAQEKDAHPLYAWAGVKLTEFMASEAKLLAQEEQ